MSRSANAQPGAESGPPARAAARSADGDLSREIEQAVDREPLDRVKCVRVFDDYYRCNWWVPGDGPPRDGAPRAAPAFWLAASTHRVRKSRFLRARRTPEGVLTEEVALLVPRAAPRPLPRRPRRPGPADDTAPAPAGEG